MKTQEEILRFILRLTDHDALDNVWKNIFLRNVIINFIAGENLLGQLHQTAGSIVSTLENKGVNVAKIEPKELVVELTKGKWKNEIDSDLHRRIKDLVYSGGELPQDLTKFLNEFYDYAIQRGRRNAKPSTEDLKDFCESFKQIIEDLKDLTFRVDDNASELKDWINDTKEMLDKEVEGKK